MLKCKAGITFGGNYPPLFDLVGSLSSVFYLSLTAQPVLSVDLTWEAGMQRPGETHICALRVQPQLISPNHSSTSGINTPQIRIIFHGTTPGVSIRSSISAERVHCGSHFPFATCISKPLTRRNALFYSPMLTLYLIVFCWVHLKLQHSVEWM